MDTMFGTTLTSAEPKVFSELLRPEKSDRLLHMVMNRFRTCIRCSVLTAGFGGLALAVGCGYSGRDEYVRIRSIAVEPVPGDGSTIASLQSAPIQFRASRAAVLASNQPRGVASDQSQSSE